MTPGRESDSPPSRLLTMDRRRFLKVGLSSMAYFTLEATTPNWIIQSAQAFDQAIFPDNRILVIVQLAGGNDGLNTVIPRTDPVYYDGSTRPTIRVPAGQELNLDGLNGLHPRLAKLAQWHQRGMLAIVNNVGYNNPNLSHFTSTDYWEYANVPGEALATEGWLMRFFDNACAGVATIDPVEIVVAGSTSLPDVLLGSARYTPPAIDQTGSYAITAGSDSALRLAAIQALNNQATIDPNIDFLQRSVNLAQASIADVAVAAAKPLINAYTTDNLGRGLQLASQIIRAGFSTNIFYVSQGGYDTHSNQVLAAGDVTTGAHAQLLSTLDQDLDAFLADMEASGNLERVLIMTFSEFGRRIGENGSKGTDHGAANCLFVAGGGVAGGVYGGQPDLAHLINGNLAYRIDFRSVYSAIMEGWLRQSSIPVFGVNNYNGVIGPQLPQLQFLRQKNKVRAPWARYT